MKNIFFIFGKVYTKFSRLVTILISISILLHIQVFSLELNWDNLAKIYKKNYELKSTNRFDKLIAEKTANAGNPWRINPQLTSSYNITTGNNSQTTSNVSLTQSFPTGTTFSLNSSQTMYNGNVTPYSFIRNDKLSSTDTFSQFSAISVTQSLLKGSFLYNLPLVSINDAKEQHSIAVADQNFAKDLRLVYLDYIDVINNSLLLKQAHASVERANFGLNEIQDSINQGFKAKSDIYSFKILLNTAQMNLNNSQAKYENSLKKLNLALLQNENTAPITIPNEIDFDSFIKFLVQKLDKKMSFEEMVAKTQLSVDKANADIIKNVALPQLDFSYSVQKNENNSPYSIQATQGNVIIPNSTSSYQEIYGFTFSMPLYSTFTRDTVSAANAKTLESKSALMQEIKTTTTNWEIDQKNIEIDENQLKIQLQIRILNAKNLEAVQNKYRDGNISNTEVQTSQDNLENSEISYIQAKTNLTISLINCAYDSGSIVDALYE